MNYRFAAVLLFSALLHGASATAGQPAAGKDCEAVSGVFYLSADDGTLLVEGNTTYQINEEPDALNQISIKNLIDGVEGTYKICRTGAHDRFGHAVANVLTFANLKFDKTN